MRFRGVSKAQQAHSERLCLLVAHERKPAFPARIKNMDGVIHFVVHGAGCGNAQKWLSREECGLIGRKVVAEIDYHVVVGLECERHDIRDGTNAMLAPPLKAGA